MRKLTWLASLIIIAAPPCFSATYAGTYQTIAIDGNFADWAGVPVLDSDGGDNPTGVDIGDIQIANDENNLYIRSTFPNNLSQSTYIALDVDENAATGFDVFSLGLIGSEAGWQNDFAFAQATGVFNTGAGLSGDYFGGGHALMAGFGDAPNREWALSLSALFAANNSPVFPNDTIRLLLYADTGSGDVSSVIDYTS
jgi:hypothetical protein